MLSGVKYINRDVFYTIFKKHNCPQCHVRLKHVKVSKIVNSKSQEAKNFNFILGDGFMEGDVKFIWKEFQCPICNKHFSIDEMKRIENGNN